MGVVIKLDHIELTTMYSISQSHNSTWDYRAARGGSLCCSPFSSSSSFCLQSRFMRDAGYHWHCSAGINLRLSRQMVIIIPFTCLCRNSIFHFFFPEKILKPTITTRNSKNISCVLFVFINVCITLYTRHDY